MLEITNKKHNDFVNLYTDPIRNIISKFFFRILETIVRQFKFSSQCHRKWGLFYVFCMKNEKNEKWIIIKNQMAVYVLVIVIDLEMK